MTGGTSRNAASSAGNVNELHREGETEKGSDEEV